MKTKVIYILCLFTTLSLFARDFPLQKKSKWATSFGNQSKKKKVLTIPYTQLFFLSIEGSKGFLPSCGFAVRSGPSLNQYFGMQGDISVSYIPGMEAPFLLTSLSGIFYPFVDSNSLGNRGWNMTFGLGYLPNLSDEGQTILWGPFSIGYEGQKLFFDVGVYAGITAFEISPFNTWSFPYFFGPSFKVGVCF